jgi:DNA-binding response OmpR family regulator
LLLRTAFEYAGFNGSFDVAADGLQAVQYLKREGFDATQSVNPLPCLALLDLGLPRLPGVALVKWIREQPDLAGLPVILMTGAETGTEAQLVTEFGANDWLVKPFGFEKLVEMAEHLCACWLTRERQLRTMHH